MNYVSTRGQVEPAGFQDTVMMGLADDGGLMVPESIPDVRAMLDGWRSLDYLSLAREVLGLYATDIPPADLAALVEKSYAGTFEGGQVAPVVHVDGFHVLELWHGPTLSFKDVALQLLGNLFEYILARRGGRMNILAATSGDTGSAAIHGVRGRRGIDIFVMHPAGRVSPIQERQMTTVPDANVHNIAIEGSFDDCQRIMKTVSSDLAFKRRYALGAVNSVNWARVLAQMVYYFHSALAVQRQTGAASVRFCVPTGNFGDILAGWYAMRMGAPISRLLCATNENDILSRFFNTGVYRIGETFETLSPAMDIQVASNFERYLYYCLDNDGSRLVRLMARFARTGSLQVSASPDGGVDPSFAAGACDYDQCLDTIEECHARHGYLLDPHTAVGVAVARQHPSADVPTICIATAHPAKFPHAILLATGEDIARHPEIDKLDKLPARCDTLPNDPAAVRDFIAAAAS